MKLDEDNDFSVFVSMLKRLRIPYKFKNIDKDQCLIEVTSTREDVPHFFAYSTHSLRVIFDNSKLSCFNLVNS